MITAEIVEVGITRRSTNIGRPGRPLWTSNCRSFEGNTITVSTKALLFVGFAHNGTVKYHPKVVESPSNIRLGLRTPESQISGPSEKTKESFSEGSPWVYSRYANHLPRDRSQDGEDRHKGIVKEISMMRCRGISRPKVALSLNPKFMGALRMFHDTVFRKRLRQRLVHSIQDGGKGQNLAK